MATEAGSCCRFLRDLGRPRSAVRRHPRVRLGWVGRCLGGMVEAVGRMQRWLQGVTRQRLHAAPVFSGVGPNHWSAHFLH